MMHSTFGRLTIERHGRVTDLHCSTTFTSNDMYNALVARRIPPAQAAAMVAGLITLKVSN